MFKEELEQILTDHRIKWLNMLSELNDELISVPEMLDVKANIIEEALTSIINLVDKEVEAKNNAYWERNQLVVFLTRLYPSWTGLHEGEDWEDDWRTIIYVKTPAGQLSWHIHDNDKQYFTHLDPVIEEWDGHTTEEKYNRLRTLAKQRAIIRGNDE